MYHNAHQIPKAIVLVLALMFMVPVAKNWQVMAGSMHDVIQQSVGQLLENIDAK